MEKVNPMTNLGPSSIPVPLLLLVFLLFEYWKIIVRIKVIADDILVSVNENVWIMSDDV